MDYTDNYDLQQLENEENKRGFVFIGRSESSEESLKSLAEILLKVGVCDKLPDKILKHKNISIFIFGGNFEAPAFFEFVNHNFFRSLGLWEVYTILELIEKLKK